MLRRGDQRRAQPVESRVGIRVVSEETWRLHRQSGPFIQREVVTDCHGCCSRRVVNQQHVVDRDRAVQLTEAEEVE